MGESPRSIGDCEYKNFPALVTKVETISDTEGIVEAFVSIMGNVDDGRDIIHMGAFSKTLVERGSRIRVLDNHRTDSTTDVVARIIEAKEVKRANLPEELLARTPDAKGGLFVKSKFLISNAYDKSYMVFQRLQEAIIDEWSIGFISLKEDFGKIERAGEKITVRNIREIELWECSPVIFAMNAATMTTTIKSADDEAKEWTPDGPVQRFGDMLRSTLHRSVSCVADDWLYMGLLTTEEHQVVLDLLDEALTTFVDGLPEDLALRPWEPVWMFFNSNKPQEQRLAEPPGDEQSPAALTPSLDLQRRRSLALAKAQLALIENRSNHHD